MRTPCGSDVYRSETISTRGPSLTTTSAAHRAYNETHVLYKVVDREALRLKLVHKPREPGPPARQHEHALAHAVQASVAVNTNHAAVGT